MIRTIITIQETDKRWLDRYSGQKGQSTAETIRLVVKAFRKKTQESGYRKTLKSTAGLLNGKDDSVRFVQKIRKEWD